MRLNLLLFFFMLYLPSIIALQVGNLVSSALDFIPVVGNVKSLGEAITGKDMVTGEELSKAERTLSILGAIPGGNWLKNGKHLEKGQKFLKAAQKGKIFESSFKNVFKATKTFFRFNRKQENNEK